MPLNPKAKLAEKKSAQDIQDEIFRRMPPAKKIKLASNLFAFARLLNPNAFKYGTRRTVEKNRRHS